MTARRSALLRHVFFRTSHRVSAGGPTSKKLITHQKSIIRHLSQTLNGNFSLLSSFINSFKITFFVKLLFLNIFLKIRLGCYNINKTYLLIHTSSQKYRAKRLKEEPLGDYRMFEGRLVPS